MAVWPSYLMINPSSSSSIPALLGTAHYSFSFIVMQVRISTPYANPKANAKANSRAVVSPAACLCAVSPFHQIHVQLEPPRPTVLLPQRSSTAAARSRIYLAHLARRTDCCSRPWVFLADSSQAGIVAMVEVVVSRQRHLIMLHVRRSTHSAR